jgi:hypothetical protein
MTLNHDDDAEFEAEFEAAQRDPLWPEFIKNWRRTHPEEARLEAELEARIKELEEEQNQAYEEWQQKQKPEEP